jgi:diadenylate cyclase
MPARSALQEPRTKDEGPRTKRTSRFDTLFLPMNQLAALLQHRSVSWWDVLDVLIVSILIYESLKLIRGTRAMQMAIGSVFVLLLFYGSRLVPLTTVNWLIRNLLAYVVIAAIVLFQQDIRRALSHLGRAPFFRYFARAEHVAETIEEVITAAGMLAKAHVGAIVVFEREIGLRNYIESGIPLDAAVSYDLLTTIFQPTTPLHDGAVIIQENRIAAAACFLPLTVSPKIDRDLGTRHRAAIGLTEESDAIAMVVSEERGEISLALQGRIERHLSLDDLRKRLHTLVMQRGHASTHPTSTAEVDA